MLEIILGFIFMTWSIGSFATYFEYKEKHPKLCYLFIFFGLTNLLVGIFMLYLGIINV